MSERENRNYSSDNIDSELAELTTLINELNIKKKELNRELEEAKAQINELVLEKRRRSGIPTTSLTNKRDRHGDVIEVGDYVNFLTKGKFNSKGGIVANVNHQRFVQVKDSKKRTINRESQNLEIVRKVGTKNDVRERHS